MSGSAAAASDFWIAARLPSSLSAVTLTFASFPLRRSSVYFFASSSRSAAMHVLADADEQHAVEECDRGERLRESGNGHGELRS